MGRPELKSGSLGLEGDVNKKVNPDLTDDGFYKCSGFHLDEALSISKWKGFQKLNSIQLVENGTPATYTGGFDFVKADQSRQQIFTTTKGVYRYNSPNQQAMNVLDYTRTGTANDLFDGVVYNDTLFFGNGVDGNLKYDGTNVRNMGITGPSTACTAAVGAATGLTGTYSYKITFYNSTLGHESNPSNDNTVSRKSNDVTVANQKIDLSSIPVSTDPQVNARKIYRTVAGGAIWLYLATISDNSTTTYTDSAADTTLGVAIDTTGNGVPPTFAFIETWKGFTWMVPKNSSRIYFSKSGSPNAVDSNDYRDLDKDDGAVITGLKRIHDTLTVYKSNSTWNAFGEERTTFGFTRQIPDIGSISNQGIVSAPGKNIHYYPSTDGFHAYNGISESIVGIGVQKDFLALNQGRLSVITGRPYKTKKLLIWLTSSGNSSQNDTIIWFDYFQEKWGTRDISSIKANIIINMFDSSNREQFYIGGYDGYIYQGDIGGSDNGAAITCDVIDRAHPRNDTSNENIKCFYHIFVWYNPVPGATINVSYALDDPEGIYISLGSIDASRASGQDHIHFKANGRRIYPRLTESSILEGHVIRGWRFYYKDMGRHNTP